MLSEEIVVLHIDVLCDDFVFGFVDYPAVRGALSLEVVLVYKHLIGVFSLLAERGLGLSDEFVLSLDHEVEWVLVLVVHTVLDDSLDVLLAGHDALEVPDGHLLLFHPLV